MLDALDLLQGFIDGRFVGQQGVGDIEVAFLFGANGRHAIQRALLHPSTDRRLLVLASCAFRDSAYAQSDRQSASRKQDFCNRDS